MTGILPAILRYTELFESRERERWSKREHLQAVPIGNESVNQNSIKGNYSIHSGNLFPQVGSSSGSSSSGNTHIKETVSGAVSGAVGVGVGVSGREDEGDLLKHLDGSTSNSNSSSNTHNMKEEEGRGGSKGSGTGTGSGTGSGSGLGSGTGTGEFNHAISCLQDLLVRSNKRIISESNTHTHNQTQTPPPLLLQTLLWLMIRCDDGEKKLCSLLLPHCEKSTSTYQRENESREWDTHHGGSSGSKLHLSTSIIPPCNIITLPGVDLDFLLRESHR